MDIDDREMPIQCDNSNYPIFYGDAHLSIQNNESYYICRRCGYRRSVMLFSETSTVFSSALTSKPEHPKAKIGSVIWVEN